MKRVKRTSWQSLILVCRKCGKDADVDLRSELRDEVRSQGMKDQVRVVATSCLDICPKGQVAVAVARPGQPLRTFIVDARGKVGRVLRQMMAEEPEP